MGFYFASLRISLVCHVAVSTILGRSQFETTMVTFEPLSLAAVIIIMTIIVVIVIVIGTSKGRKRAT